jgi:hypothetical protein
VFLSGVDEFGVPEAKEDPRGEVGFPGGLGGDGGVHEGEEEVGVVLDFDVDVEFDIAVLWLEGEVSKFCAVNERKETYTHEELDGFLEGGDGQVRLLLGADVLDDAFPGLLANETGAIGCALKS